MNKPLLFGSMFVIAVATVAPCFGGQRAGDAIASPSLFGSRTLFLPDFSIARPGEFTFEVNLAGAPTYPHWLRIKSPSLSDETDHSAESARIRVDVLTHNGKVLHSKLVNLRSGQAAGSNVLQYPIWNLRERGRFTADRYLVRVSILEPSPNRFDSARVVAATVR